MGRATPVRGTVSRAETHRERPQPWASAVPAMQEETTRACLGWGGTRSEDRGQGDGVHTHMRSWWPERVRGACPSDLTGPSLCLVSTALFVMRCASLFRLFCNRASFHPSRGIYCSKNYTRQISIIAGIIYPIVFRCDAAFLSRQSCLCTLTHKCKKG